MVLVWCVRIHGVPKYISEQVLEWSGVNDIPKKTLTCSPLLHFLRRNGEDREYLSHDLHKYLHHFRGQRNLGTIPEALEGVLDALKEFDKGIVARSHILRCL